jgi:hypothetical protein
MAGPQWVQPWEGGRRGLSLGGLSHGSESQNGSSHEKDVMGPVAVAPVTKGTSRWVPSRTVGPVGGSSRKKQVKRSTKSTAIVLQL